MNEQQEQVVKDIVNVIRLGIKAGGYVDLTDKEIREVLDHLPKSMQPPKLRNPEIIAISTIDPGELLLSAANNSAHMNIELQKAIARFINIWSTPTQVNINLDIWGNEPQCH